MEKIYLSVIIPAYNEEKTVSKTLLDIDRYLSGQDYSYEIIVVNDDSKDDTAKIVKKFESLIKNLRLIDSQPNHGKGYAVRRGMLEANGQHRLFMDMDNATSIEHIEKAWPYLKQGYHVVIGSRDKKDVAETKQAIPQPFLKRQVGNLGNILIQLVAVPGIWDTQCGFKIFTDKAAKDIFSRAKIERWALDIEALALARRLKYKIAIIPVYWVNNPNSRVNLRGYLRTFGELFKIKWNLIRGRYKINKRPLA